jgi:hypothetical protein
MVGISQYAYFSNLAYNIFSSMRQIAFFKLPATTVQAMQVFKVFKKQPCCLAVKVTRLGKRIFIVPPLPYFFLSDVVGVTTCFSVKMRVKIKVFV